MEKILESNFDCQSVSAAILSAKSTSLAYLVHFAPHFPEAQLNRAKEVFAQQAENEEILAFILSEHTGKAGFLFTDRAMYFRKVYAHKQEISRFPYDIIAKVEKTKEKLVVMGNEQPLIIWDLKARGLTEQPREIIANAAVELLKTIPRQAVLHDQADPADTTSTTPLITVAPPPPPDDWIKICAFHGPIIFIGIPLMWIALALMMKGDLLDYESSRIIEHIGAFRAFFLCAFWMAPSIYGFGKNLEFSFGKYISAIVALTFMMMFMAMKGASRGEDVFIAFPVGGGVLALLLAYGLGNAGLSVLKMFRKNNAEQPDKV